MKRYTLQDNGTAFDPWPELVEHPEGKWVRHDDALTLCQELERQRDLATEAAYACAAREHDAEKAHAEARKAENGALRAELIETQRANAATLEHLLKLKDELRAAKDRLLWRQVDQDLSGFWGKAAAKLTQERDKARATVAELRDTLEHIRDCGICGGSAASVVAREALEASEP